MTSRDWSDLSPYFAPVEILSPSILAVPAAWGLVDAEALGMLNAFRRELGRPLLVNHAGLKLRGVRSASEQLEVVRKYGGALMSQHVAGRAFDLTCPGLTVGKLAALARDFGWHCVGSYPSKNFVHVDRRTLFSPAQVLYSA